MLELEFRDSYINYLTEWYKEDPRWGEFNTIGERALDQWMGR